MLADGRLRRRSDAVEGCYMGGLVLWASAGAPVTRACAPTSAPVPQSKQLRHQLPDVLIEVADDGSEILSVIHRRFVVGLEIGMTRRGLKRIVWEGACRDRMHSGYGLAGSPFRVKYRVLVTVPEVRRSSCQIRSGHACHNRPTSVEPIDDGPGQVRASAL